MSETLAGFLTEVKAEPDLIQQALGLYIAARTKDRPPSAMRADLNAAIGEGASVEDLLDTLKQDPAALDYLALAFFDYEWQDAARRPAIRSAFTYARDQLPFLETLLLAIVAMYGLYLVKPPITERTHTIRRSADGSYEETTVEKAEPFAPIVGVVAGLFKPAVSGQSGGAEAGAGATPSPDPKSG